MLNCGQDYFKQQRPIQEYYTPKVWRASITLKEEMIGRLYKRLEAEERAAWSKPGDDTPSSNLENKTFEEPDW